MDLLESREEEELFKTRLLNIEEKPLKRITKRLVTLHRVVAASVRQEQTPPPDGEGEGGEEKRDGHEKGAEDRRAVLAQLREDATLDFAALDASIARLRFLQAANAAERARYAADATMVAAEGDAVRVDLARLRGQLADARAQLAVRRGFDVLADRITQSRTLLPRPDQRATIAKLEDECRQLAAESAAYTATWRERRAQFARIMDESMRLRRLIRDEKEEVERRAGMEEDGGAGAEGGGENEAATQMPADSGAAAATPATAAAAAAAAGASQPTGTGDNSTAHTPQAGATPQPEATTPQPEAAATLQPEGANNETNNNDDDGLLKPPPGTPAAHAFSRAGSQAGSRAASREATPAQQQHTPAADTPPAANTAIAANDLEDDLEDDTDVDMVEMVGMPQLADEESPGGDTMDTT